MGHSNYMSLEYSFTIFMIFIYIEDRNVAPLWVQSLHFNLLAAAL